jgi:glucose/arabinose dehydrogenase
MQIKRILLLLPLILSAFTGSQTVVKLKEVASGINSPVAMGVPGDGSGRLFICEQGGRVLLIKDGRLMQEPFLDISSKMVRINGIYDERGLLGIAFHPDFKKNRKFYVYYSAPSSVKGSNHKTVLEEYLASANPDKALSQGKTILEIEQPESNHNGGQLAFGPDGYLYLGPGDGGGAGDKHGTTGNGQNLNTLLGKILRIDVNKGNPYSIPPDNPFLRSGKPEIWAYGLRNPWRFSFDKVTGRLYCADVGQNEYEEVNLIEKGKNYGWRIMEGKHCYQPSKNCDQKGLELPVYEYNHSVGKSITGGFVYRGIKTSPFYGKYIYADWTGKLFALHEENKVWINRVLLMQGADDIYITSFGEDEKGELYMLVNENISPKGNKGTVYKLLL